jgi:hypothetical protein
MLLSTEPLGRRHRARATLHRRASLAITLVFAFYHAVLLVPYHLSFFAGETVEGTILQLRHSATKDDEGDTVHHYRIHVDVPGIGILADEVSREVYGKLQHGQRIPVRRCPTHPAEWSNIGPRATVSPVAPIIGLILLGLTGIVYLVVARRRRWFEGKVVDTGKGTLEKSLASGKEEVDSR